MDDGAIHGCDRIVRSTLKVALNHGLFVPTSTSDIRDTSMIAALFQVDTSSYGGWTVPPRPLPISTVNSAQYLLGAGKRLDHGCRHIDGIDLSH